MLRPATAGGHPPDKESEESLRPSSFSLFLLGLRQLAVALLQEAVVGNDGPGVCPLADGAPVVAGLHPEGDELPVFRHAGDGGRGPDGHAHRGGGAVLQLQPGAHGAAALVQRGGNAHPAGFFGQCHQRGGGKHVQRAAAHGLCGVLGSNGDTLLAADSSFQHKNTSFPDARRRKFRNTLLEYHTFGTDAPVWAFFSANLFLFGAICGIIGPNGWET